MSEELQTYKVVAGQISNGRQIFKKGDTLELTAVKAAKMINTVELVEDAVKAEPTKPSTPEVKTDGGDNSKASTPEAVNTGPEKDEKGRFVKSKKS